MHIRFGRKSCTNSSGCPLVFTSSNHLPERRAVPEKLQSRKPNWRQAPSLVNELTAWHRSCFTQSMKTRLLAALLLTAGCVFGGISVGIHIGPPPPPRVVAVRPVAPGPGYFWVDGYWYPVRGHYRWHDGYWTRPPYEGAHWVAPRHESGLYINGYWEGSRGRIEHNHRWDRRHERDYHHDRR